MQAEKGVGNRFPRRTPLGRLSAVGLWLVLSCGILVEAQTTRDGRVLVTVVDQTEAVIPGAVVTVTALDGGPPPAPLPPVKTSDQGVATVSGLRPGRYAIQAEFPGFETRVVPDVRVRAGDNRQTVTLAIEKLQDTVNVERDRQEAAADRRSVTFGSALTREQIDALADDPDLLRQQLADMAGPGAVIRIDSFEGAPLPPKSQIKSIHITRDGFAAENHNAGASFIDIVTQPGIGPLRGQTNYRIRDGSLTGRSPFTPIKGRERLQVFGLQFGGTLQSNRSSFNVSTQGIASYETPNLNVALPAGRRAEALGLQAPRNNFNLQALFDYALTPDQTLRIAMNRNATANRNLGVGAFDLAERAYESHDSFSNLRVQEAGPLGRRAFMNTRVNVNWLHFEQRSVVEAPTLRVNDAFTSGGAQLAGRRDVRTVNLASDIDYVRGIHSFRTGLAIDAIWTRSDLSANYLGTYTFESLAAYEAGTPRSFTRRVGNPATEYVQVPGAVYVQDDIRIRRNLTLSPGLRYEIQAHIRDYNNLAPRVGFTWAPFRGGRTTVRGSAGIFYDWMNGNTYEQVLRVDGTRQQELNVMNPTYPSAPTAAGLLPSDRYLFGSDLQSLRNSRVSAGLDQTLMATPTWSMRFNVLYAYIRGAHLWRGLNLNAPVAGLRPDPGAANIVAVVSDASSQQQQLTLGFNVGLPPQPPGNSTPRFWNWKRFAVYGTYTVSHARSDTDGDFAVAPTGKLADDWGRSLADIPYRLNVNLTSLQVRNLTYTLSLNGGAGLPYTLRTGTDENGDLLYNDRPAGIERNTLRGVPQWTLSGFFSYSIPIRKRAVPVPGIMIGSVAGTTPTSVATFSDSVRYRLNIIVQAQNITDRANYTGYSGVMTSPFFGQPTAVLNPRRVDVGLQFSF